ncbi:MAG: FtsX-like permease family protein [Candidatus Eisenbacteria bacterium]|nr:FtsX-like permease family protein [Candidatus Latescibacterota bacterium]MBD3303028.1 FtsX-like permease family protein [Candidatus Eisenbacteria bacterium]
MLGILIGIASVILLTSIGEGTRLYILNEFTQFGTNLVAINPGKVETTGIPGAVGGTTHPLTISDAIALERVRGVREVVPVAMGTAGVEYAGLERSVYVYGVTARAPEAWKMDVRVGRFLPDGDPRYASPVAVLGPTLKRELFGERNALGEHVRIGGQRFLVIGIMEPKGQFLGFDIDDSAYIPVSLAQPLFNRDDLMEIDLLVHNQSIIDTVVARMKDLLIERHGGEEDFTITTQTGMLETLDNVIRIVSLAVVGIGAISLLVGAIGILTMMWISVSERTAEIGLAKAIGATPRQILRLYLGEAALLSTIGGILGLATGIGLAQAIHLLVPALPVHTPVEYVVLALGVSTSVGVLSGILPARRAAAMDPVEALAAE